MAHIQDTWWREKKDAVTGELILGRNNRPLLEKTPLYGKGRRYRVRYIDPNDKERSKSFPDKKLKEAEKFRTKVENDLFAGSYIAPDAGKITIEEYGEIYKKGRSQDKRSKRILNCLFKHQIYRFMGHMTLNHVAADSTVIREWLFWLNDESQISVNYQYEAWCNLSAMLDAAVADKKVSTNPCKNRSISAPKPIANKIRPWHDSKMQRIHESLRPECQIAVPLGAGLGLRQGEILAFSPDDIDRKEMLYHCRRQIVYTDGILEFKLPKGHKTRTIPLGRGTLEQIDYHTEVYPSVKVTLPWAERDSKETETATLLMPRRSETAWIGSRFNTNIWKPAFKAAGIEYVKGDDGMHALRHLYASHLLSQGVSIKELAAYLGHSSEAFTLKTYVHLLSSSFERARLATDTLFTPSGSLAAVEPPAPLLALQNTASLVFSDGMVTA